MKQLAELISIIKPEFQGITSYLFSILIILIILNWFLKYLLTKEMKFFLCKSSQLVKSLFVKVAKKSQLPAKYPSLEFIGSALFTIFCYFMALHLYAVFIWINIFAYLSGNVIIWKRISAFLLAVFFILFARLFFAEGERNRFLIPALWKNFRK